MPAEALIETVDLSKTYGSQVAVDRLCLQVREGEIFGFLGPNGAGKTTTLLMLLGLSEPTAGSARVLGFDPSREPIPVKRQVAYLQENMGFYRDLTGRQMLRFIAELNGLSVLQAEERMTNALETVGLADQADKKIGAYSRGMRQRLALAEVVIKEARVAFLDEPTLGLDPEGTNRIIALIEEMCRSRGMTVIISSHLLYQVQRICHRVGIMIAGRMVAQGSMEELGREKLGVGPEQYTLEELFLKYFSEAPR
jgi:ABC-2 type transport system ATP-binding protein